MSIADGILAAGAVLYGLSLPALIATGKLHVGHSCDHAARSAPVAEVLPALRTASLQADMPRADAARLLGIDDRAARGLCAAGVLEALPYDGRPARVTSESVSRLLASKNGQGEVV